jgi:hypothetical protein
MLQWHSDAQRQATIEDWALERMIAIHAYRNPQQKGTISDLVRLFASSKYAIFPLRTYLTPRAGPRRV